MAVRRWEPFSELMSLRQAMDRLFEDSYVRPGAVGVAAPGYVPFDVWETTDAIEVKASLPGWKPDDVDITVTGDTLTVRGEWKQEAAEQAPERNWHLKEIRHASFARSMTLPSAIKGDAVEAHFEHGVLTIHIPKADEVKPRQIKVTAREAIEAAPVN